MKKLLSNLGLCVALSSLSCFGGDVTQQPDCTQNAALCGAGQTCDANTKSCVTPGGACSGPAQCAASSTPVCSDAMMCVPCSGDAQCQAWSLARSQTPPLSVCASGSCVECGAAKDCADPAKPACDATSHSCRPCQADGECTSGICRKPGDYPETAPVSGLQTGQCVPEANVAWASNNGTGCSDTGAGTMAQPYCSLTKAIASGKPYIKILPSSTSYAAVTLATGNVVLTGPGRDAAMAATLSSVTASGGATVTVSGIKVAGSASGTNGALTCLGGATLYVRDATVTNSGRGVNAETGCAKLFMERTRVANTSGYGIVIGTAGTTTTQFRIVNTAVVNCGTVATGELHGVYLGGKSSGTFAFNTLNNNNRGINCGGAQPISDSIVAGGGTGNTVDVCTATRVVTSGVDLATGLDPKLTMPSQNNTACCIDKAQQPVAPQTVPTDYFGTARPLGNAYDIGYHEAQ